MSQFSAFFQNRIFAEFRRASVVVYCRPAVRMRAVHARMQTAVTSRIIKSRDAAVERVTNNMKLEWRSVEHIRRGC